MKLGLLFKFFPIPRSLSLGGTGLDISDQSAKVVSLKREANGCTLADFGETAIPLGIIEGGKVKNQSGLAAILQELRAKHHLGYVVASLPEEPAYVVRIRLPFMPESELRDSIELQLEEHIPLPAAEVEFDYEIFARPLNEAEGYDLSVSIIPKNVLADYQLAMKTAGLTPVAIEIEAQSLARSLIRTADKKTYLIADLGKTRTGFCIVSRGVILFTVTLNSIGGENLTTAIQKNLGISYAEAEKRKMEKGLRRSLEDKQVFESIIPVVSVWRDEINRYRSYWETHKDEGEIKDKISGIVLCGGQASLPGLVDYLASNLGLPVAIGNPWVNILTEDANVPSIDFNNSLRYATAAGLALRNLPAS